MPGVLPADSLSLPSLLRRPEGGSRATLEPDFETSEGVAAELLLLGQAGAVTGRGISFCTGCTGHTVKGLACIITLHFLGAWVLAIEVFKAANDDSLFQSFAKVRFSVTLSCRILFACRHFGRFREYAGWAPLQFT